MLGNRENFSKPADSAHQGSEQTGQTDDDAGDKSSSNEHDTYRGDHRPGGRSRKLNPFMMILFRIGIHKLFRSSRR